MDDLDFGVVLRSLHELVPSDIPHSLSRLAERIGAGDMTAFLIDFEQSTLIPVPERGIRLESPIDMAGDDTPEGLAFVARDMVESVVDSGTRACVPLIEGSECTGVLAFTVSGRLDDRTRRQCEELGMLVGAAISIAARYTDWLEFGAPTSGHEPAGQHPVGSPATAPLEHPGGLVEWCPRTCLRRGWRLL